QIVHWKINHIGAKKGDPKMQLAELLVHHSACDLGKPMIDAAKHNENWRNSHHHMEVSHNEHRRRKRHIDDDIAEEQARDPAIDERDEESNSEQHRDCEVDVPAPQSQSPVVDFYCGRDGDDEGRGGEKEPKIGVHAADIHVVAPDNEAEDGDDHDCPNHHAIAEDVFARMGADQVGDDTEGWKSDDIDLRMAEKPKEVLKQYWTAARVAEMFPGLDESRHEEACPKCPVEQHHDAGYE